MSSEAMLCGSLYPTISPCPLMPAARDLPHGATPAPAQPDAHRLGRRGRCLYSSPGIKLARTIIDSCTAVGCDSRVARRARGCREDRDGARRREGFMIHRIGSWRPPSGIRAAFPLALAAGLVRPAWAQGGAQAPAYEVDAAWPKPLPNNWLIGQIGGLAVDKHDHIWVHQRPRSLTDDELGAVPNTPVRSAPRSVCCKPAPSVMEF